MKKTSLTWLKHGFWAWIAFSLGILPSNGQTKKPTKAVSTESVEKTSRMNIPLDADWKFQLSEDATALAANTFDDSNWEQISLPHTWNAFDGQGQAFIYPYNNGKNHFEGTGWYRTHVKLPQIAKGKRTLIEFDGANKETKVFVNGKEAGIHIGGFARFRFDITDLVDFSKDNIIAVRVNNEKRDIIPRGGDFTHFGGIYRKARILLTEPVHIATMDYASSGVYLTPSNITPKNADVNALVKLTNDSKSKFVGNVKVIIKNAEGKTVSNISSLVTINAKGNQNIKVKLNVKEPHLWNGLKDPYCYRATIQLLDANNKKLDEVEQPLGFRTVKIHPEEGFALNNQIVNMHGVNLHQDRQDKGWAIDTNDISEDLKIIKEVGANTVRLCHYQHSQYTLDQCDKMGFTVWAELVFVGDAPETEFGLANAKEQLKELIRQNYNHPSIFTWSIGNETGGGSKVVGMAKRCDDVMAQLKPIVGEEDSTRLSSYASDHKKSDPRNFRTDILGVNIYKGWYSGTYSDFGKWADTFHLNYPKRSLGFSEYGAGSGLSQHEDNPPVRTYLAKGPWHPEEWQTKFHEEYWLQIKERPWIWASYIWCMFDFGVSNRAEGDIFGRNDKGIVTYDRQTRKDVFYWYKANWTSEPMIHITSKRFCDRTVSKTNIKIYSNCTEVEAWLNGVSLGKKSSSNCIFIWPEIELSSGTNRIQTVAYKNNKPVVSDACGWKYRADGEALPYKFISEQDSIKNIVREK